MAQQYLNSRNEMPLTGLLEPYQPDHSDLKPAMMADDEMFIKKVMDENPEKGTELLYRRYFQPLCSHAVKYVSSKAIAEDLVSEVFYELYKTGAFTEIKSSFRFYLFRSVRNRAFNYLKSQLKRVESYDEKYDPGISEVQSPYAVSQFEEMYQDVHNAVNNLPIERRRIYLMSRFEGKRYQEIADELSLSIKTVEVQLYRANKYIRALLRDKWMLILTISILN